MTPRPIYRWKSFWLGLLILIFLGWSWARSMEHFDIGAYVFPAKQEALFLRNMPGTIEIEYTGRDYSFTPVSPPIQWYSYSQADNDSWQPRLVLFHKFATHGWTTDLPYSIVIPCYLFLWIALLVWRGRRFRRLTAALPGPDSDP